MHEHDCNITLIEAHWMTRKSVTESRSNESKIKWRTDLWRLHFMISNWYFVITMHLPVDWCKWWSIVCLRVIRRATQKVNFPFLFHTYLIIVFYFLYPKRTSSNLNKNRGQQVKILLICNSFQWIFDSTSK